MSDNTTEEGAQRLANIIKAYWAERGWFVTTRLEYIPGRHIGERRFEGHWRIHSDTLNGMPTRRIVAAAA